MVFLRSVGFPERETILTAERVFLRAPAAHDYGAWSLLREKSRNFLKPWEPLWPADDLSRASYRRRLRRYAREMREDRAYPFFVFNAADGALMGGATLSNVRRGVAQTASLGYWMGEAFAGKGFMTEAVGRLLGHAFGPLRLHRVEAACLPHNQPSTRLLQKAGFRREGYARSYLCINGRWEDHLLFARLAQEADHSSASPGFIEFDEAAWQLREKETL